MQHASAAEGATSPEASNPNVNDADRGTLRSVDLRRGSGTGYRYIGDPECSAGFGIEPDGRDQAFKA